LSAIESRGASVFAEAVEKSFEEIKVVVYSVSALATVPDLRKSLKSM
jgi:hypothetical protein